MTNQSRWKHLLKPMLGALLALLPCLSAHAAPVLEIVTENVRVDGVAKAVENVYAVDGAKRVLLGNVATVPAGTTFHHWDTIGATERIGKEKGVPADLVDFYSTQHTNQAFGGGFYVSKHPTDSMKFGNRVSQNKTTREIRILHCEDRGALMETSFFDEKLPVEQFQIDWDALWKQFREKGLSGAYYGMKEGNWFNFIDPTAFRDSSVPRDASFIFDHYQKHGGVIEAAELIGLDEKLGITGPHPFLEKHFPELNKILAKKKLTPAEAEKAWSTYRELLARLDYSNFSGPLADKFRKYFHEKIEEEARALIKPLMRPDGTVIPEKRLAYESYLSHLIENGLQPADLFPDDVSINKVAGVSVPFKYDYTASSLQDVKGLGEYGTNLTHTFEFVDMNDILIEMATGKAEPWKRYDEPGKTPTIERWRAATRKPLPEAESQYIGIYRVLSENPSGTYRDTPVVAGGDIDVAGKGYYRVTEKQRRVLEANPLLVTEFVPDPAPPHPELKTVLARHEYPSARTYAKFRDKLPAALQRELDAARDAGALADVTSDKSKELTRKVIAALIKSAEEAPGATDISTYQTLMAVHPFSDYNGRTLRANYLRNVWRPLFLRNWDIDLFLNYEEFAAEVEAGRTQMGHIFKGIVEAAETNPNFPDYYGRPETWQVAAGSYTLKEPPGDFVERIRSWYAKPETQNLVRQKQYLDVGVNLDRECLRRRLFIRLL